jgi:hypothetical protein
VVNSATYILGLYSFPIIIGGIRNMYNGVFPGLVRDVGLLLWENNADEHASGLQRLVDSLEPYSELDVYKYKQASPVYDYSPKTADFHKKVASL